VFVEGKPVGRHLTYFAKKDIFQKDEERIAHLFSYDSEGKLHGEEKTFYEDGKLQAFLLYEHGLTNGLKQMWDPQGILIEEAKYVRGVLEGRYFQKGQDGKEVITTYHKNLKNGPHLIFYPPNDKGLKIKALEASFTNDQFDGIVTEYSNEGIKISQIPYVEGKKQGKAALFSPDGKTSATVEFVNDLKNGSVVQYFPNGSIYRETYYIDDKREGEEKTYHRDGKIASIFCYRNDQLEGLAQSWNKEGVLVFEAEYMDNMRHGKFNKYFDDGKPYLEQTFVYDKAEGPKRKYDVNGDMTVANYEAGELVER
jgi:antitoxin component YwqK of YwqJK toxin-antitoxin module